MIKWSYFSSTLLVVYLIKLLLGTSSIADSLIVIALASLCAFNYYYYKPKDTEVNKELKDRVLDIEELLKTTRDKVNSISLGNSLRK